MTGAPGATVVALGVILGAPTVITGLVAITLFSFILSYNEFLFAHFLLQRTDLQTIPVYVGYLSTSLVVYWAVIHAVLALTIIPMIVLILVFRKFVNISQLAGALKGS